MSRIEKFKDLLEEAKRILDETLQGLSDFKTGLKSIRSNIDAMPGMFKGFALSDFHSGTGMSHDEWLSFADRLIENVRLISDALSEAERADFSPSSLSKLKESFKPLSSRMDSITGSLERFRRYLLTIPGKLQLIPSFIPISSELKRSMEENAPRYAEAVKRLVGSLKKLSETLEKV